MISSDLITKIKTKNVKIVVPDKGKEHPKGTHNSEEEHKFRSVR